MPSKTGAPRVLMVCTGNICRSAMAHYMLEQAAARAGVEVEVDSCGISAEEFGNPIDPRARRQLLADGYECPPHRARQITDADLHWADLILAMTRQHLGAVQRRRDKIARQLPAGKPRLEMLLAFAPPQMVGTNLDLADPWYGTQEDFVLTSAQIEAALPGVLAALPPRHGR